MAAGEEISNLSENSPNPQVRRGANNDPSFNEPTSARRRCLHCDARLPTRGRPGRFCSRACRRAANRVAAPPAPRQAPTPYAEDAVAREFRAAVAAWDGTLRDLSEALRAEGIVKSAASLSAYQRGASRMPPGKWLYTLDRILGLESGTLRAALGSAPAMRAVEPAVDPETVRLQQKIGQHAGGRLDNYVVTAVRDEVHVDELGRPGRIDVDLGVQAQEDDVACCWVIVSADSPGTRSDVRDARGCQVGHKILLDADHTAFQMVFRRTLAAGARCKIRFTVVHQYVGPAEPFHRRCVPGHWIGDLVIRVHFATLPKAVHQSEWPLRDASSIWRRASTDGRVVLMHRPAPAPGTYGVEWVF